MIIGPVQYSGTATVFSSKSLRLWLTRALKPVGSFIIYCLRVEFLSITVLSLKQKRVIVMDFFKKFKIGKPVKTVIIKVRPAKASQKTIETDAAFRRLMELNDLAKEYFEGKRHIASKGYLAPFSQEGLPEFQNVLDVGECQKGVDMLEYFLNYNRPKYRELVWNLHWHYEDGVIANIAVDGTGILVV